MFTRLTDTALSINSIFVCIVIVRGEVFEELSTCPFDCEVLRANESPNSLLCPDILMFSHLFRQSADHVDRAADLDMQHGWCIGICNVIQQ